MNCAFFPLLFLINYTGAMDHSERPKFSLASGIAKEAKGLFKDVSLTPQLTRAQLEISQYIRSVIPDGHGCLHEVLERRINTQIDLISHHLDQPLASLIPLLNALLSSEQALAEFVREIDQLYGKKFDERPYFQRIGQSADPQDPYTHSDVRQRLEQFRQMLLNK